MQVRTSSTQKHFEIIYLVTNIINTAYRLINN